MPISNSERQLVSVISLIMLLLAFISLLARLFYLQIIKGGDFEQEARISTTYMLIESAPRGIIYDREHRVLASNKQSASILILPEITLKHDLTQIAIILARILNKPSSELLAELKKLDHKSGKPITWKNNLTLEQVAAIYENQHKLPGITIQQQATRHYVHGEILAHVIGYTGKISSAELENYPERNLNDWIGKYGLEKRFDDELRGTDSLKRIRVNKLGQPLEPVDLDKVNTSESSPGEDLILTIDLDLQKVAYESMKDLKGATVVIEVETGDVLALVSKPSFNPNLFTTEVSQKQWAELNKSKAFLNRAISAYPPGSIWKPIVLLAALEDKVVKPGDRLAVSGAYFMGRTRFGDWTGRSAVMSLEEALAWSRDTAFYQMGAMMTEPEISAWGKKFGASKATGIELPNENHGSVPDEAWRKSHGVTWYPGNTLHYSIGQGPLLVTPVQAVRFAAAFANDGRIPKLHLLKKLGDRPMPEPEFEALKATQSSFRVVKAGMEQCIESGTGQAAKLDYFLAAGKTGSAEAPPNPRTHGWFIAYAPVQKPEIAVAVFAEAGGHGGSVAAPVARSIFEAYFAKTYGAHDQISPSGSSVVKVDQSIRD
ncbi:MAG: penicillin-binding protein 2 [Candidatus Caenarcaniphilales bacterium]|nr:penicillin-binding protein 2 [Candidatus Caenarcaniphilales bacterium]